MGYSLTASTPEGGASFEPVSPGLHDAVCFMFAEIGTHAGDFGPKRQLVIGFETPHEKDEEGKPKQIIGWYNATLKTSKAKLRQHLSSWRGKEIADGDEVDFGKLPGAPAVIQVMHYQNAEGYTRAKINTIASCANTYPMPETVCYYDFSMGGNIPPEIPDHIAERIRMSPEFAAAGDVHIEAGDAKQAQEDAGNVDIF